jgi:hypothetical protein
MGWCVGEGSRRTWHRGHCQRGRGRGRVTRPDEDPAVFIHRDTPYLDEFRLQIVKVVVVERELALQGTIREAFVLLEPVDDLGEGLFKGHSLPFASLVPLWYASLDANLTRTLAGTPCREKTGMTITLVALLHARSSPIHSRLHPVSGPVPPATLWPPAGQRCRSPRRLRSQPLTRIEASGGFRRSCWSRIGPDKAVARIVSHV